ncbi:hypothetical protein [Turneriella parva]|uniref:Uncharacterized protein n=1 Tax=Turneriella parva (strain ATCC BAA-1111 / DSM 21527 / NCTC 11395 / H) TaxID=869212 RepID=I4B937_TURPD|nr:hypothetical protein [Turneriella parva]AFM13794.1 hypothetical protein Turpa_3155 [Turneriella parva DSM 21527]
MAGLAAAFDLFRGGLFAEAKAAAQQILADEPQNIWAYYLAAISAAFEPDLKEFENYLAEFEAALLHTPGRPHETDAPLYLHYLKAWHALLARDVEKALWHYLQIADQPEGWLARSLIKKFRKVKEITNPAFHAADYVVLPATLPPPKRPLPAKSPLPAILPQKESTGWQYAKPRQLKLPQIRLAAFSWWRLMIALAFMSVATTGYFYHRYRSARAAEPQVPQLQVADSAAVMPVVDPAKILYRYKTREAIIADFDRAKANLKANKVNQTRYLLLRLLHSNADFQTREKSRLFVGFIPEPDFAAFNDNLRLKDLFEDIRLRRDSLVVIGGELRDAIAEGKGMLYQFIANENGEEYRIHAYRSEIVKEETRSETQGKRTVQVYGRFKGLVGAQQAIYVEALRVWR